ncbi:hypothetical protein RM780_03885 [Streptomyces sp. DSM 44917]|uniref:Uncharacterized protein n=1 Tax=Streptomyces boetiae TaxID=3075541 RepID=A0ABU2L456_9ACTN|nr:hypothetical protein [Streptomyces sp. DSM 44917]MDT0306103.1 hypothetical protein [Streptomyces sp. DSM 44917]
MNTQTGTTPWWYDRLNGLANSIDLWTGRSGRPLTGPEVAGHLDAARDLLDSRGWGSTRQARVYRALTATSTGVHDTDSRSAAAALLDLVQQARTGAGSPVDYEAWEARAGRTWREVEELLAEAAQYAREHGPAGGA